MYSSGSQLSPLCLPGDIQHCLKTFLVVTAEGCVCVCCWHIVAEATVLPNILCACTLSSSTHVQLFATPWTVACQFPLSVRFPRQEYCSGLPLPPLGDLLDLGMAPMSPALQTNCLLTELSGKTYKSMCILLIVISAATWELGWEVSS